MRSRTSAPALRLVILLFLSAGCRGKHDIGRLAEDIQSDSRETRYGAAKQIEEKIERGVDASAAVEALGAALADEDSKVRYRAAKSLAKLGESAAPAVGELAVALLDSENDTRTRYYVAKSLYKLGDDRIQAIDELTKATRDPAPEVVCYVAKALRKIGPDALSALPALRRLSKSEDTNVRTAARDAIKKIKGE